jgi:hypothetical protein
MRLEKRYMELGGEGRCARMGNTLKLTSLTKLARLGHFPPASMAGRLAGPVFYMYMSLIWLALPREYTVMSNE